MLARTACKQFEIGPRKEALDAAIHFVGLGAVLTDRRDDDLVHVLGKALR